MSFKCKKCGETFSSSKMAGIAFGHIARSVLESKGILSKEGLASAFDKGDFSAGVLSGLKVCCPKCDSSHWS